MPIRYRTLISDSARWDGFAFRPDDIVISTPPKCGTTWMQMICALLVFQTHDLRRAARPHLAVARHAHPRRDDVVRRPRRADAPPVHQDPHAVRRPARSTRASRTSCVGRDPRDVALSWDNHMANMDLRGAVRRARRARSASTTSPSCSPTVRRCRPNRRSSASGSGSTSRRRRRRADAGGLVGTAAPPLRRSGRVRDEPNVVLFHYDDLKADLEGQMRRLADHLGIVGSRGALARARGCRDVRAHARRRRPHRARHDARDLAGQPAVLPPRRQRPVARAARRERPAALQRRGSPSCADPDLARWLHRESQSVR